MTIVDRLHKLIDERGIKNNEFARRIGGPQSTFQTWFSKREDFPARFVMPICRELGITPELLLEGVETPPVSIPADFVQLSEQERFLIESVRSLDQEGAIVVTNKAVEEMRRMRSMQGINANAESRIG